MAGAASLAACSSEYTVKETLFPNLNTFTTKLAAADSSRVMIEFSDRSGNVWLGDANVTSNGGGFFLSTTISTKSFDWKTYGRRVMDEWYGARTAGSASMGVFELFYRPSS